MRRICISCALLEQDEWSKNKAAIGNARPGPVSQAKHRDVLLSTAPHCRHARFCGSQSHQGPVRGLLGIGLNLYKLCVLLLLIIITLKLEITIMRIL